MSFFQQIQNTASQLASEISTALNLDGAVGSHSPVNRYGSFAPPREGNNTKWFVDGCGYFWAVSEAIEQAKESIWILDWWLSPELYLRRPPSDNEQYRLDRMLLAAAKRGVKVNIIVYKEVTLALTLPHPWRTFARTGLNAAFKFLETLEANYPLIPPPITVASEHTKHALESLHENIVVFRHPDHLPDRQSVESSFLSALKSMKNISAIPEETLKALYGVHEDTILFWAHHEKLCIIDGSIAFMGGLDMCFGRWDTNQHSISDAHPGNLDLIVFPGQDYNNARIMDFHDVGQWQQNKLNRCTNSRMGWSDISFCLSGPVIDDLRTHFVQRWNFIFNDKYAADKNPRYTLLAMPIHHEFPDHHEYHHHGQGLRGLRDDIVGRAQDAIGRLQSPVSNEQSPLEPHQQVSGMIPCQIVRSCTRWSHGVNTEHSVANAYIDIIKNSKHFIYIENQFFITATSDAQYPIQNKIGAAIVDRILRAARAKETYHIIVCIPALPGFAGDLRSDESSSARAVLKYQYLSICRGKHSILETIKNAGFDPAEYITFYNLRNYDRINSSATMKEAEQQSGVSYEEARKQIDDVLGAGFGGKGKGTGVEPGQANKYDQYQQAAAKLKSNNIEDTSGRWDSVAECYMESKTDIRNVPWRTSPDGGTTELDAFVSEELYIHTKLMIADDNTVICGSANLNDRSQLGSHDSEIAVVVEDPDGVDSSMAGQPGRASRFAASLRRHIFRKHLGLLPPQDMRQPNDNFHPLPTPNKYDWSSSADSAVTDPLSPSFQELWRTTAQRNTAAFAKVFHAIPDDRVRTWDDYQKYYERYFKEDTTAAEKRDLYLWGHVVKEDFPAGEEGVKAVKEVLSRIKGNLVEMPLRFLEEEEIAKEGVELNFLTAEVYT